MALKQINVGSGPNATDADSARDAFIKSNLNSSEIENRLRLIERTTFPFGSYTDPGFLPFEGFQYGTDDWSGYTSVAKFHDTDALGAVSTTGNARVFPLSETRFVMATIASTTMYIRVYELSGSAINKVASTTLSVTSNPRILSAVAVSDSFFKIFLYVAGATSYVVEAVFSGSTITASILSGSSSLSPAEYAMVNGGTMTPSNQNRASLLGGVSALMVFGSSHASKAHQIFASRFTLGQAQNVRYDVSISHGAPSAIPGSYDYLGNNRFISVAAGSPVNDFTGQACITVFDATDAEVSVKGHAYMPGVIDGGVSVFAISPTLAIACWSSSGIQKAIAVGIDHGGRPTFLGAMSSAGTLGSPIVAGATMNPDALLAASWPVDTEAGRFVTLKVDTDTGVISSGSAMSYSQTWMSARAKFMDVIRLSANRVLVVIQPQVTPFGIGFDVLDFS